LQFIYPAFMSSLLQIRNVPEETRRALKARAASRGESLNAFVLALLEREVARPTAAEVLERARTRTEHADLSSLELIAAARAQRDRPR
jgi:plasmid stability protein